MLADVVPGGAELEARLALAAVSGIGSVGHRERCQRHGSAVRALADVPTAARVAALDFARRTLAALGAVGGRALAPGDEHYPGELLDLPDPPAVLFAIGDVSLLRRPMVSIVGTRVATRSGLRVARHLGETVARAGAVVVSGMARGIDAEAHLGALEAGGPTIAVLGTGPDVAYPRAHVTLHRRIAECGLLLSELPPGERADAGSFPRRNRLIAALGRVTVVVEAGHRSGALITAAHALDLGRGVAAVPGPIDVPQCAGSNLLLRDGAQVITDAADLTQLAGLAAPRRAPEPALVGAAAALWEALRDGAADVETLAARARLPARACLTALSELELAGLVTCALTGEVARR